MKQPVRSQSLLAIMVLSATIILSTLVVWSDLQEASGSIALSDWDKIQNESVPFTLALTGNASKHFDNELVNGESKGEDLFVSESKFVPIWESSIVRDEAKSPDNNVTLINVQDNNGDLQESASTYQKTRMVKPRRKRRRKPNHAQWRRNFQRTKGQQFLKDNPNRPYYQHLKKNKKKKEAEPVGKFPSWNTFHPHRPRTKGLFPGNELPNAIDFKLNTIEADDDLPSNGRGFNTKVLNKVTAFLNSSENETESAPPIDPASYALPMVHPALYDHTPWKPYTQAPRVRTIAKESNYYYDARLVPVGEVSELDLKPTSSKLAGRQQRRSFRTRSKTKKKPYKALVQVYKSTNRGYPGPVESTTEYNFDVFPTHQQLNDEDYYFDNFVKEFADEFPEKEVATTPVPPPEHGKDVIQSRYEESILVPDDHVKDIYEDYFYVDDPDYAQPEPKHPPPPPPSRLHSHGPYRALRQTGYPVRYRKQLPLPPTRPPVSHTGYPEYDQYQPNIPITPIPNYRFPKSEFSKYFPSKRVKPKLTRINKHPARGYLKQKLVRPPVVHVAPPTAPPPPRPPPYSAPPYNTPGPYYDVTQIPAEPISYDSDDDEYYQRPPRPRAPGPDEFQRLQKAYMQLLAQNNKPEEENEPVQEEVAEYDQEEQPAPRPAYQEERPDYYEEDERRPREPSQYEDSREKEPLSEYEDISQYDDIKPEEIFEYGAQTDEGGRGLQDPREYVQRNTANSFDAGWDEFFNGHRDNIDNDIGSISQSNENYGAPEGGSQEQAPNQEEGQSDGEQEERERERSPYDSRDSRDRDREEGKGFSAARYKGDDYDEPPDYESPGNEEFKGNYSPDYERDEGSTAHPAGDPDVRQRERGDYARFKHLEDQEKLAEETHDSDYDDDDYDEPAGGQRVRRPLTPMKYAHGEMVVEDFPLGNDMADKQSSDPNLPGFDQFFSQIEENIDGEIGDNKEKKRRKWKEPSYDGEDKDRPADGSDDNGQDLRPNRYREVAPDEFDYQMPSHEELQENYKTETSSSEIDPIAVPWSPQKVNVA